MLYISCLFKKRDAAVTTGGRPRYRSITVRIVMYFYRQWRDELTAAGKCLTWAIAITGLGTVSVQMPIYQVFCGLVTLLAAGAAAGFVFRPRVSIRGQFPDRGVCGEPLTATFTLKNLRLIPAYDVGLGIFGLPAAFTTDEDRELVPRLGRGESASVTVTITPQRRGRFELPDLRAYSTFPFYIGRSGKVAQPIEPLLVLPNFEPLAGLVLPQGGRYQPGGIALTSRVGESPEYIGNREYVPGEPVRRLDFRAWARTGTPVVREYQEEFYSRVGIVLDTQLALPRRLPPGGHRRFEAAIALTAAVAAALSGEAGTAGGRGSGGEYIIDLFIAGTTQHTFRSGRNVSQFDAVLDVLAAVGPGGGDPATRLGPELSQELTRVSTVVYILLDWTPNRRALCEQILQAGCQLKPLFVVSDNSPLLHQTPDLPEAVVLRPQDIARGGLNL